MYFGLTESELTFLAEHVGPADVVWEYGSGLTTMFLAQRCKRITAVEHLPSFAAAATLWAANSGQRNVSVLYVPPNLPYEDGGEDDGDLSTFRDYVEAYVGRGVDVILIDGRARVECARWIAERAPFGPHPDMRIFLHDADRESLAPIFTDSVTEGEDGPLPVKSPFVEDKRVGKLALLRARL